jgi:hypothetical protein
MRSPNREEWIGWGKVATSVLGNIIVADNPFTWRSIVGYVISTIMGLSGLYQGSPAGNVSQITPEPQKPMQGVRTAVVDAPDPSLPITHVMPSQLVPQEPIYVTRIANPESNIKLPLTNNAGQIIPPDATLQKGQVVQPAAGVGAGVITP